MAELNNNSFDRFTQIVFDDASDERSRILEEVNARRDQALQEAEDAERAKMRQAIQDESVRVEAESGREISRHMLESKRRIATRREAMADEVFGAVREKLMAYHSTPDYRENLKKLYCKAFETLGNPYDAVIYLRKEDLDMDSELARLLPGRHVEFQEGSFALGGLIMDCQSKMQRVDLTYDTALSELDGHFAELFGLRLSDE